MKKIIKIHPPSILHVQSFYRGVSLSYLRKVWNLNLLSVWILVNPKGKSILKRNHRIWGIVFPYMTW